MPQEHAISSEALPQEITLRQLTLTALLGIPLVWPGDNLAELIIEGAKRASLQLQDGDIIVLAQKIVSKAEGRWMNLGQVIPSPRALELAAQTEKDPRLVELILRESNQVLRHRPGTIIVEHRLGFVCASAGIDHSNVPNPHIKSTAEITTGQNRAEESSHTNHSTEEWVLLLPENPDASAERIRQSLQAASDVHLGVLIIDSHGRAWRMGTVGVAIGLAGMPGLVDLRGQPDLFDFRLQITQLGAADELAAAASLVMGQASEGSPVVLARGFPYALREGSLPELLRPHQQDLFR